MRTLRSLALVFLLATGGCQLLGDFFVEAVGMGIEAGIDAIDGGHPPPPPPHRSPRVLDRTRHR
jgi:hypothetical protein